MGWWSDSRCKPSVLPKKKKETHFSFIFTVNSHKQGFVGEGMLQNTVTVLTYKLSNKTWRRAIM
jgi:hypothetical protein